YGDDSETYTHIYEGLTLWFLGHTDEGLACLRTALSTAERLGYAFTVAGVLSFTGQLHQLAGDVPAMREIAERAIAFATEQSFPAWLAISVVHRGWIRTQEGDVRGGIAEIEEGIATYRATGAMLNVHYFLSLLADAQRASSARAEGLATLAE